MPLTEKGKKILENMKKQYGAEKGKQVFYASINKGKIEDAERKSEKKGSVDAIDLLAKKIALYLTGNESRVITPVDPTRVESKKSITVAGRDIPVIEHSTKKVVLPSNTKEAINVAADTIGSILKSSSARKSLAHTINNVVCSILKDAFITEAESALEQGNRNLAKIYSIAAIHALKAKHE